MNDAKYGPQTRAFLAATEAKAVITIVIDGALGHGMASAAEGGSLHPVVVAEMLRRLAKQFDHAAASDASFDTTVTPARGTRQ